MIPMNSPQSTIPPFGTLPQSKCVPLLDEEKTAQWLEKKLKSQFSGKIVAAVASLMAALLFTLLTFWLVYGLIYFITFWIVELDNLSFWL